MQQELIFAGFGGQGIMFLGQLVAYAAMDEGYQVTWIPSYGPEMRGGTAYCYVVISDHMIGSPVVRNPRTGMIFNQPSMDKFGPQVAPGGILTYNTSMIQISRPRTDVTLIGVPATETADLLGDKQITNMVMLGALLEVHPILTLDVIHRALENHLPAHRRNKLPLNLRALELGAGYAREVCIT